MRFHCVTPPNRSAHFAFAATIGLFATMVQADDWPQWRGPNRDGLWNETGILQTFPQGGLNVRWRVPVGPGWSSPIVAEGRVYVTDSELVRPKARERIHCFDEASGEVLWTHAYEVDYAEWVYGEGQGGGPRSTPIVEGGRIYALGGLGHLCCLDGRTGAVIWQRNLAADYQVREFTGTTASPLVEGNLLIASIGGKPAACVVAFDKGTGKEVWHALKEPPGYSSPLVISAGGTRQFIIWTGASVTSLDPATGQSFWRERFVTATEYAVSTPIQSDDRLLVGGLMLQLAADKPAATVLWPENTSSKGRILSNVATALLRDGHVYSARSSGHLVCLDAQSGRQIWETDKVTGLQSGASIQLTANGGSMLLFNDRGELIRAHLTPAGYDEISRVALIEPTSPFGNRKVAWPPPAYANHHVFVRNDRELICASLAEN
jgi:outer membrane protein assembly factor BamB